MSNLEINTYLSLFLKPSRIYVAVRGDLLYDCANVSDIVWLPYWEELVSKQACVEFQESFKWIVKQ